MNEELHQESTEKDLNPFTTTPPPADEAPTKVEAKTETEVVAEAIAGATGQDVEKLKEEIPVGLENVMSDAEADKKAAGSKKAKAGSKKAKSKKAKAGSKKAKAESKPKKKGPTIQSTIIRELQVVTGKDEQGRTVGRPYEDILATIRKEHKGCQTSIHCLRWYVSKINCGAFPGIKLPQFRPRS